MLPLPRRRLDPEVVRERLAVLAGGALPSRSSAPGGLSLLVPTPSEPEDVAGVVDDPPVVVSSSSLRPVVVAVAATAFVAWIVVHVTVGGSPSTVQVVPGTPLPAASGVLGSSGSAQAGANGPGVGGSAATGAAAASPGSGATTAAVVVQVIGQVRRPGLVTLPQGSRVADAVAAAGGLVRGGSSGGLNLARLVVDGEQILVSPDAVAQPAGVGATDAAGAVVDLNSATLSDLDGLPGVGPVMAGRILDWRTAHGKFSTVDQLREVSGIGARTFERLRPHVRV